MGDRRHQTAFRWVQERLGQALLLLSLLGAVAVTGSGHALLGSASLYAGLVPLLLFQLLISTKKTDILMMPALLFAAAALHIITPMRPIPDQLVACLTASNLCLAGYFVPYIGSLADISLFRSRFAALIGGLVALYAVSVFPALDDLWVGPALICGSAWLAATIAVLSPLPFALAPFGAFLLLVIQAAFVLPETLAVPLGMVQTALVLYAGFFILTIGGSLGTDRV